MAAMDEAFWADLDAQIVANRPDGRGRSPVPLAGNPPAPAPKPGVSPPSAGWVPSDWTGVLDTLTAAKSAAQEQDTRLRDQAAAQDALLQDLKRAQQEIRAYEVLLREVQTQAEAKLADVQAQAEAQLRVAHAEAAARLTAMAGRAESAELRAAAAEDWLKRIEQASRDLLPSEQRAAA